MDCVDCGMRLGIKRGRAIPATDKGRETLIEYLPMWLDWENDWENDKVTNWACAATEIRSHGQTVFLHLLLYVHLNFSVHESTWDFATHFVV